MTRCEDERTFAGLKTVSALEVSFIGKDEAISRSHFSGRFGFFEREKGKNTNTCSAKKQRIKWLKSQQ